MAYGHTWDWHPIDVQDVEAAEKEGFVTQVKDERYNAQIFAPSHEYRAFLRLVAARKRKAWLGL